MKKVLVMGGSYFIGRHVVNLLKDSYEVYVLNRGNKPFNDGIVHELVCDRNESSQLFEVLSPIQFNYVIDISGYTKTQSSYIIKSLNLSVLEKFVYISTSAVYNIEIAIPPFAEKDPLGGESPFKDYANNKLAAEEYLLEHIDQNKLVILRPPIVYGEDNYILRERLIFYVIENNYPIYIPATDNFISFVYVKDLANDIKLSFDGIIPGGIYNVGNKDPLKFTEWVNLCAKVMKKDASIVYVDTKKPLVKVTHFFPFYDYNNILSVDKIKQYSPNETPIEIGLKKAYIDYLTLKDPIQMPERMLLMRKTLESLYNKV